MISRYYLTNQAFYPMIWKKEQHMAEKQNPPVPNLVKARGGVLK